METPVNVLPDPLNSAPGSPVVATPPRWRYGWLLLVIVGPLLLSILKLVPGFDQPMLHSPLVHVIVAGGASALGVLLALLVLHVALLARDGRVYLVGMGFLCIASIFAIHAIST